MKIEYLASQIIIEPESVFEENYLKGFCFETTYGHFEHSPDTKEDKLLQLIIPKKIII
jgi:hypothetical protein